LVALVIANIVKSPFVSSGAAFASNDAVAAKASNAEEFRILLMKSA
jgi:hypothetical protein